MDSKDAYRKGEEITGNDPDLQDGEKKKPDKKIKFTRIIAGLVVLATCVAALMTYSLMNKEPEVKDILSQQQEEATAVIEDKSLVYSFIIPFEHTGEYAYIIVEVAFDVPDGNLRGEMTGKQNLIRTIIYNTLLGEVERAKAVPSPAEIKKNINREVNAVLENGNINDVFVTKYMAV